jgi:hypothetical protein
MHGACFHFNCLLAGMLARGARCRAVVTYMLDVVTPVMCQTVRLHLRTQSHVGVHVGCMWAKRLPL